MDPHDVVMVCLRADDPLEQAVIDQSGIEIVSVADVNDQSRLDVSKDGVDPFEGRLFGGLRAAASLNLSVRASSRCDGGETRERIGDDVGAASKRRAREFANRHLSEADDAAKNDLIWLAVLGCCNGEPNSRTRSKTRRSRSSV